MRRHLESFNRLKNALPSDELKIKKDVEKKPKKFFKKATKDFSKKDSEKEYLSKSSKSHQIMDRNKQLADEMNIWIATKKIKGFIDNKEKYNTRRENRKLEINGSRIEQMTNNAGRIKYLAKPFLDKIIQERERPGLGKRTTEIMASDIINYAGDTP